VNVNIHTRTHQLVAATATALCLATSALVAFEPPSQPLAERVAAADAVVQAVVDHVEYRMSRPSADQPSIPFTFVTFRIERVILGQVDGGLLTLRFHGGLFPDGRFLDDPTAPLFDVGERSLLLVSRNGDLDVPLAGWRFGRLRVINGRVYDDFGKPLAIVSPDRVRFGRTVRFAEIAEHTLGASGRSFNPRVREVPAAGDLADVGAFPIVAQPAVDDAAGVDAVIAWMRALRPAGAPRLTASQDPNVPFLPRSHPAVARTR
jgi:hypothetical protein